MFYNQHRIISLETNKLRAIDMNNPTRRLALSRNTVTKIRKKISTLKPPPLKRPAPVEEDEASLPSSGKENVLPPPPKRQKRRSADRDLITIIPEAPRRLRSIVQPTSAPSFPLHLNLYTMPELKVEEVTD